MTLRPPLVSFLTYPAISLWAEVSAESISSSAPRRWAESLVLGAEGFLYGFDEFYALFYAEYGENSARHDLVFGGEVIEVSVHGALHESDDDSSVIRFLSDYLLEFRV